MRTELTMYVDGESMVTALDDERTGTYSIKPFTEAAREHEGGSDLPRAWRRLILANLTRPGSLTYGRIEFRWARAEEPDDG
jgi:hypothetical protein